MGTKELKPTGCLILGGGEIANYLAVRAQIKRKDFILCADSGYLHCEKLEVKPDLLLGDFDSIEKIPDGIARVTYPADKNYTDSWLAVREAVKRGYTRILMAGMLGRRLDHTWGNLQNLAWCAKSGVDAKITDGDTEVFAVKDGEIIIPARENAYLSVFSLEGTSRGVTISNGKYPLKDYDLSFDDPRAVSNEFQGTDIRVSVKSGIVAVITVNNAK